MPESQILDSNPDLGSLGKMIEAIDRPGDYYAEGRLNAPMPRIEVEGAGVLSFPILSNQAKALVANAIRAPYGRGEETIHDPEVRNCWQIAPDNLQVGGRAWENSLKEILDRVRRDLGYPARAVGSELYKLLIYETGGFFAPHRDTEKTDGMVATLVLALPGSSAGGELVIRHQERETVIDMRTDDPSELVYAAFYADCEHEIRTITDGHRICMVYNLILQPGGQVPAKAPDHSSRIEPIARELKARFDDQAAPRKIVWVLEHDYSMAGLSFGTLKGTDAAIARILKDSAARAECVIHAAILHVSETAGVEYFGWDHEAEDVDESEYEVHEIFDWEHKLDSWIRPDDDRPDFDGMKLVPNELVPTRNLDRVKPDSVSLTEASGNEGASIERLYLRAALVMWPTAQTARAVASAGAKALTSLLDHQRECRKKGLPTYAPLETLATDAVANWPSPRESWIDRGEAWRQATTSALTLLGESARPETASRFLQSVVLPNYCRPMIAAVLRSAALLGVDAIGAPLRTLIRNKFPDNTDEIIDLVWQLAEFFDEDEESGWRDTMREITGTIAARMAVLGQKKDKEDDDRPSWYRGEDRKRLSVDTLAQYFALIWHYRLEDQASPATTHLLESPKLVSPSRTLPDLLKRLAGTHPEIAKKSAAMTALWQSSATLLVGRSPTPPRAPIDWKTPASKLTCKCDWCVEIRRFCADPDREHCRIPTAQYNRQHIREKCRGAEIDIGFETEREGRPFTLVCTKTRTRFARQRKRYKKDIEEMKKLVDAAQTLSCPEDMTAELRKTLSCAK